jgi:hypothetical protein
MLKRLLAMFLLAGTACTSAGPTESSTADPAVYVTGYSFQSCAGSASPLPGWRGCQGTVTLTINKALSSGYVSVFFNYPDAGSFYHGQLQVGSGVPGRVVVNVVNDYVSQCLTSYPSRFDVYDGPQSLQGAPLLLSLPQTLSVTCG